MSRANQCIPVDRALDGARILHRHFFSTLPPIEGWVREFSTDGRLVRISKTNKKTDAGLWHRSAELRVEAVLEAARAPATEKEIDANSDRLHGLPDESGELGLGGA